MDADRGRGRGRTLGLTRFRTKMTYFAIWCQPLVLVRSVTCGGKKRETYIEDSDSLAIHMICAVRATGVRQYVKARGSPTCVLLSPGPTKTTKTTEGENVLQTRNNCSTTWNPADKVEPHPSQPRHSSHKVTEAEQKKCSPSHWPVFPPLPLPNEEEQTTKQPKKKKRGKLEKKKLTSSNRFLNTTLTSS